MGETVLPRAEDALKACLADPDTEVRLKAAEALRLMGSGTDVNFDDSSMHVITSGKTKVARYTVETPELPIVSIFVQDEDTSASPAGSSRRRCASSSARHLVAGISPFPRLLGTRTPRTADKPSFHMPQATPELKTRSGVIVDERSTRVRFDPSPFASV
jgi:hypothetical protein